MRTKWNNELMDQWAIDNNMPYYRIDNYPYISIHTKRIYKCKIDGHVWEPRFASLLIGTGCPKCSGKVTPTNESVDEEIKKYKVQAKRIAGVYIKIMPNGLKYWYTVLKCENGNCTNEWEIRVKDIKRRGCPKCNASKGETIIDNYLKSKGYIYKREHKFIDCRDKGPLRFDFWIEQYNVVIEFHGQQHYKDCNFGSKVEGAAWNNFLNNNKRDNIKKNYCLNKGINFIEIPYFEFDNIEKILDEKLGELKRLKELSNKAS